MIPFTAISYVRHDIATEDVASLTIGLTIPVDLAQRWQNDDAVVPWTALLDAGKTFGIFLKSTDWSSTDPAELHPDFNVIEVTWEVPQSRFTVGDSIWIVRDIVQMTEETLRVISDV